MRIAVEKELHMSAPEGVAVYVQNTAYTSAEGLTLLEGAKHEAMAIASATDKTYYHPRIFRRRSTDNGRTWSSESDIATEHPDDLAGERICTPVHLLDKNQDTLICLYATYEIDPSEPMFTGGNLRQRTYRMRYQLSRDGGKTWTNSEQVIDSRAEYDATNWGPGLEYGQNGGMANLLGYTWLDDGTLVFGLTVSNVEIHDSDNEFVEEGNWGVKYVRASWNHDNTDLEFQCGDTITVGPDVASGGCAEPALVSLGGSRLFNTMRCQGDESTGLYSSRQSTISEDGGLTWSEPEPLRYDDGSPVWTPASYSQFFPLSKTGKIYWIANILPGPVHGQTPRYPLTIAEFDADRCCILRDTVQTIYDLPDGAPTERRYTNWGSYEERGTGDLILTMPEQPKSMNYTDMTKPEEFTADCIRFKITIED